MYSQAATHSLADVNRAPYPNQSYKPGDWMENSQSSNRRSKMIVRAVLYFLLEAALNLCVQVIGSLVGLAVLIVIGVVVGVLVSKNKSSSSSDSSNSGVKQTDPNDPSTFVKDPALHQAFYGIAYTPEGSQLPNCGNSLGTCSFSQNESNNHFPCSKCHYGCPGTFDLPYGAF